MRHCRGNPADIPACDTTVDLGKFWNVLDLSRGQPCTYAMDPTDKLLANFFQNAAVDGKPPRYTLLATPGPTPETSGMCSTQREHSVQAIDSKGKNSRRMPQRDCGVGTASASVLGAPGTVCDIPKWQGCTFHDIEWSFERTKPEYVCLPVRLMYLQVSSKCNTLLGSFTCTTTFPRTSACAVYTNTFEL
jgi:hypothetical protein